MSTITNQITRLRSAADFLAAQGPLLSGLEDDGTVWLGVSVGFVGIYVQESDSEETPVDQREVMRELRQSLGLRGQWDKSAYSNDFRLIHYNSDTMLQVEIVADRQAVCTKRVVGTETKVIPAVEAKPETTEEVEVVEWDCGNLLDDGGHITDDMADSHHTDPDDPDTPEAYGDFSDLVGDESEA